MADFVDITDDFSSADLDMFKSNHNNNAHFEIAEEENEEGYMSSDFAGSDNDEDDQVFGQIRKRIVSGTARDRLAEGDISVASLDRLSTQDDYSQSGSGHCSLVYGFIPKGCYSHPIKSGAILGSK